MTLPVSPLQPLTVLKGQTNGKLPESILTSFPGQAGGCAITLVSPAARSFKALFARAKSAGHVLKTDTPAHSYRTYEQQVAFFTQNYTTTYLQGRPTKQWRGQTWYQRPGVPVVALPGSSNHGWGRAVDTGEESDGDVYAENFDPATLDWLVRNEQRFGISHEIQSEPWHLRYFAGDTPPQAVLDWEASQQPPSPLEDNVTTIVYATGKATVLVDPGTKLWEPIASNSDVALYQKIGVPKKSLSPAEWERLEDLTRH